MILAWMEGLRRSVSSPRMILLLWVVNLVAALPAAWVVTSSLQASMGHSLVSERLQDRFDMGWYGEYHDAAKGLEKSFSPDLAGPGAVYANLETWITGRVFDLPAEVLGVAAIYLLMWILLQGGIVAWMVRPRSGFHAARFLESGARFFFRYLRLALLSGVLYVLVFRGSWWVYGKMGEWTRDVPAERPVLLLALGILAITGIVLCVVQAVFTYAKIVTVIEDRRSMVLALFHGLQVLISRLLRTAGLYGIFAVVSAAVLGVYAWLAPVAGPSSSLGVLLAFAFGQAYLVGRLTLRLSLLGGMISLHPADGSQSHQKGRFHGRVD